GPPPPGTAPSEWGGRLRAVTATLCVGCGGCPGGRLPPAPRPGRIRLCRSDQRQRARPKAARQASRRPVRAEVSSSTGNLWFPVEGLDELVLVLGAEVGLDDLGVPEHVGGRTVGHDPAPVEGDE